MLLRRREHRRVQDHQLVRGQQEAQLAHHQCPCPPLSRRQTRLHHGKCLLWKNSQIIT